MGMNFLDSSVGGSTWSDRYVSARLDIPDMPEPNIELKNTQKVFYVNIILIFISTFVLIFEISFWKYIDREYELRRKILKKRHSKNGKILIRQRTI